MVCQTEAGGYSLGRKDRLQDRRDGQGEGGETEEVGGFPPG